MSLSSMSSLESERSGTSRSASEFLGCSSLEGSASLPKRAAHSDHRSYNGSPTLIDVDDPIWCSEYAQDILSYLRHIENSRTLVMYKSPQIYHRANLIALIKRIAEREKLARTTAHLGRHNDIKSIPAVYMLDVFMDTYKIITTKLDLVVFVCVLIAAKIEERDQTIPKICTLNSYAENQYSRCEFKRLERMVLNFFKWSLLVPTTATFLEMVAHQTVTPIEIYEPQPQEELVDDSFLSHDEINVPEVSETCNNLVFEFLELTLLERHFVNVKPSYLSAACIAASRKVCNITPVWPERLQSLTKCNCATISKHVEALICLRNYLNKKSIDKIKKTPDSGCMTDTESDSHDDDVYNCPIPIKRQRLTY